MHLRYGRSENYETEANAESLGVGGDGSFVGGEVSRGNGNRSRHYGTGADALQQPDEHQNGAIGIFGSILVLCQYLTFFDSK